MLLAATLLVLGLLFEQLVTLVVAVLITVILAVGLSAVASRLERVGVPRPLGAMVALLGLLGVAVAVALLVIPVFANEINTFVNSLPSIVDALREKARSLTGAKPGQFGNELQHFLRGYTQHPVRLVGPLASVATTLLGLIGAIVLILLSAYYMAARPDPLVDGLLRLFPPHQRRHVLEVMERLRSGWIGWMQGLAASMAILGLLVFAGLRIIGLEFAVVFAVTTAVSVVVPYLGALASGVPPVLFALTKSPGTALAVLGLYILAHQVEGNVIGPLIMARAVKLHAAMIAIGVVVIGKLFGLVGLIIATPILVMVVILVEEFWVRPQEVRDGAVEALGLPRGGGLAKRRRR